MAHPASTLRAVTYIHNAGTATERATTKTSVPLLRRRIIDVTPAELKRQINGALEDIHAATIGGRSIPFGGPLVVLKSISFTNGTSRVLAHRLKTDKVVLLLVSHPTLLTAGSPLVWVNSVDGTNISLQPLGTFTADIILGVSV